jgi:dihydropyrimidinase
VNHGGDTFTLSGPITVNGDLTIGGTTTLFDMCIPARDQDPLAAFELWNSKSKGQSACDYSYHLAITRFDENVERQLREVDARS